MPTFILIGGTIAAVVWVVSLMLAIAAFRSSARRGIMLAGIALAICVLGLVFKIQYGTEVTTKVSTEGGYSEVRKSGWHVDSRWFFATSAVVSAFALVGAIRKDRQAERAGAGALAPGV